MIRKTKLLIYFLVLIVLSSTIFVVIKKIKGENLLNIQFESLPYKVEYYLGEELDLKGTIIRAYKRNGKNYIVNNNLINFSGFSSEVEGKQVINARYKDFNITFDIIVKKLPQETPILISIEIDQVPTKTIYRVGEKISLSGGIIKLNYSDGSIKRISLIRDYILVFDSSVPVEEYQVVVTFKELSTNNIFNTFFTVKIEE